MLRKLNATTVIRRTNHLIALECLVAAGNAMNNTKDAIADVVCYVRLLMVLTTVISQFGDDQVTTPSLSGMRTKICGSNAVLEK